MNIIKNLNILFLLTSAFLLNTAMATESVAELELKAQPTSELSKLLANAKKNNFYPQYSKDTIPVQKEDYKKNYMSLRGLTGVYINIDDIIKGAKSRDIILSQNLKQIVIEKLKVAGMTLLNKREIKLIQGQPELNVYAAYPKHLGPFKENQPEVEFNKACCHASTWTSFAQGATILNNPNTNYRLSTWGEGHSTSDCSNLTDWYQETVLKTIDNFIEAKIKADSEYENARKVKLLKSTAKPQKTVSAKSKNKVLQPEKKSSCEILTTEYLELFDSDESAISVKKVGSLDKVIKSMKNCPHYNFIVETHSDSRSEIEYNKLLSLERADTLKNYLMKNGIKQSRFTTKAFGESKPLLKGDIDIVHITNRRVVIIPILIDDHSDGEK